MGGFLGALAPIGQTLSGAIQVGQIRQQQQANRESFGKALDALGPDPEFDLARQMFKSGASPEAITGILQGPVGKELMAQHLSGEAQRIFNDPNLSTEQQMTQWGAASGNWDPFLKMKEFEFKPHPATVQDKLDSIHEILGNSEYKLTPGDRAIGEAAVRTGNPELVDNFENALKKYGGTAKETADPFTEDQLKAESMADPKFGRVVQDYPTLARQMPKKDFLRFASTIEKPSTAEKTTMDQEAQALDSLNVLLQAGQKVLPSIGPGGSTLSMAGPAYRWIQRHRSVPDFQAYEQAQTAIIPHLRALANTGRVNQPELDIASEGLLGANSIESLRRAVTMAQGSIQRAYQRLKDQNLVITGIDNEGKKNEVIHLGPAPPPDVPNYGGSEDDYINRSRGD